MAAEIGDIQPVPTFGLARQDAQRLRVPAERVVFIMDGQGSGWQPMEVASNQTLNYLTEFDDPEAEAVLHAREDVNILIGGVFGTSISRHDR